MENSEQRDFWAGEFGTVWVELGPFLDTSFRPVTDLLIAEAGDLSGLRVLDLGCGPGTLARRLAASAAQVTALDISTVMVAAARRGAPANMDVIEADAQTHLFAKGAFDLIVSQFGTMFFADTVAALANLRRALCPGGRFVFVSWGASDSNPWFSGPRAIAVAATGPVETDPDAPGPLRFRDIDAVTGWLNDAGWRDVCGRAVALDLTQPGSIDEVSRYATMFGGAAAVLKYHEADRATRMRVAEAIKPVLAPYERDGAVHVPATVNLFTARA